MSVHQRHFRACRLLHGLCFLVFGALIGGFAPLHADDPVARYLEGLRQRRLFALAEAWCYERLAEPDSSPEKQAQLTLELSRTLTEHAAYTASRDRFDLWQRARATADEFLK